MESPSLRWFLKKIYELISLNLLNAIFGEHKFFQEQKDVVTKELSVLRYKNYLVAQLLLSFDGSFWLNRSFQNHISFFLISLP